MSEQPQTESSSFAKHTVWDEVCSELEHEYVELTIPRDCVVCTQAKFQGHIMPVAGGDHVFICKGCWYETACRMLSIPVEPGTIDLGSITRQLEERFDNASRDPAEDDEIEWEVTPIAAPNGGAGPLPAT